MSGLPFTVGDINATWGIRRIKTTVNGQLTLKFTKSSEIQKGINMTFGIDPVELHGIETAFVSAI